MNNTTITGVDIARDVIKMLDTKKLIAESGVYFESEGDEIYPLPALRAAEPCHVCAIGGLFSSLVCKTADDTASLSASKMREKLELYFSPEQLAFIETAFERDRFYCDLVSIDDLGAITAARNFGYAYPSDDSRLRAICQNIIDHDGRFVPADLPHSKGK